ncbi:tubulin beta chain-like [Topomyia yanbarensis]|uniref:tubulin beta chain-like n=1 Tax=Topomyia yanbarensis TaxID=2498891 RepID=UPI00273C07CF|nr:tubulin beta chain-like [Topomyia yanbarensis]
MREIVALHLGQCGNKIANSFWETICDEHCLNERGQFIGKHYLPLQRINVYFEEAPCCNFVPRAIFADLEPGTLNGLRTSRFGKLFSPESMVSGILGAGNNWARGYHTEGAEMMDRLMNVARKMVESCDCFQGFQLVHSIGGGTGSGLGTLVMENLKDEYPRKILNTFSVIPSPKVSEVVVEPYNAVFTLNSMIDCSDETFCLDNEALFDINMTTLRIEKPTLDDLNHLISMAMSGITCSFRYPGQLNSDLRKLLTNMVPFRKLHFFVPGIAPLTSKENQCYKQLSVPELVYQIFDERNLMAACSPTKGKYLTAAALFRGRVSTRNVEEQMANIRQKNSNCFTPWIPNNVKSAICDIPPRGMKMAATFIANTTAITQLFNRLLDQFGVMYRRKAFLHWYTGEGMEEGEITEAEQNLRELVNEYEAHDTGDGGGSTKGSVCND